MNLIQIIELKAGGMGSGPNKPCPQCGPKGSGQNLYHGTSSDRIESINKIGVKVKKGIPTFTESREEAIGYAKMIAEERGTNPILITLRKEASRHFDSGDTDVGHSTYRETNKRHITREHFENVEEIKSRPQDQVYDKQSLDKTFGKKMTRKQYLNHLRKQFDRKDNENEK